MPIPRPSTPGSRPSVRAGGPTVGPSCRPIVVPSSPTREDAELLTMAIRVATRSARHGGAPFGCVIAQADLVVGIGTNEVRSRFDPTAHAEVAGITAACRRLGRGLLSDCVLYASCEPCPMCLTAAAWARLSRVVFAADRDAARAAGYEPELAYDGLAGTQDDAALPVQRAFAAGAGEPFDAWHAAVDRERMDREQADRQGTEATTAARG